MEPASVEFLNREDFGFVARKLADWCHDCSLCSYSGKKPDTAFGRLMEWHRGWCPAWAARIRLYGDEELSA